MPTLPALNLKSNENHSPHLVILGAGASLAACPRGDSRGKTLPVMANLVSVLGIDSLLRQGGLRWDQGANFEVIYDQLASSDAHQDLRLAVESRVRQYFRSLTLPDRVTLYDLLLVSLRPKDLIATFNWDPFLLQAYERNRLIQKLPRVVFLHGNVYMGYCSEHRKKGYLTQTCNTCGKAFQPSPLLFPVTRKDYRSNPFIAGEWNELESSLNHAYLLTIFGYAAPNSDAAARELLLKTWRANSKRELAEIEIVDVLPLETLKARWRDFPVRHHWGAVKRFRRCIQVRHPRRSCEAFAFATLRLDPWPTRRIPQFRRLDHLHDWIKPLVEEEEALENQGVPLKRPEKVQRSA